MFFIQSVDTGKYKKIEASHLEKIGVTEHQNLSFILTVSFEEQKSTGDQGWRGSITSVQSGEKSYFTTLSEATRFINRYLPASNSGLFLLKKFYRFLIKRLRN